MNYFYIYTLLLVMNQSRAVLYPYVLYLLFRRLHWYTYLGDFFNTFKAFIGTNYQSLPFAFSNSGLGVSIY